jgi:hypothetical protein
MDKLLTEFTVAIRKLKVFLVIVTNMLFGLRSRRSVMWLKETSVFRDAPCDLHDHFETSIHCQELFTNVFNVNGHFNIQ